MLYMLLGATHFNHLESDEHYVCRSNCRIKVAFSVEFWVFAIINILPVMIKRASLPTYALY